ncbi:conserved hypothetical protein [Desulfovibrionales bacterium]
MSIYLRQIEQLVALQCLDSEILQLNGDLETAPKEVETLNEAWHKVDANRAQMVQKIALLKEQRSHLEHEIEEDNLKVKKSKNKLMLVSNTKEYHAIMREMDGLEKLNRLREEEKITLADELEHHETVLFELEATALDLKIQLDNKQASLTARTSDAQFRLKRLSWDRKASGKNVPIPVLGRYEFIRSRLTPPVIVPVDQGMCTGCHISIPPQSFIELQKGQQILSCPNCQRLIYWCEHFTPPAGA